MMFVFILVLIIVLSVYLPWRLGGLLTLKKKWPLYMLFLVGLVSMGAAMPLMTRFDNVFVTIYYNFATTWLGVFLYLSIFMILFELVNLVYKRPHRKSAFTVIGLTVILTVYTLINGTVLNVVNVTIPVKNLTKELKIAQISDVHLGASRGETYLQDIVKKTNAFNPDFVVITGDIVDSKVALTKNMLAPLKDLKAPAYFVIGNHEVYVGVKETIKQLQENNVIVLQNDVLQTNGIKLIGLNYMKSDDSVYDPHQVTDETIKETLPTLDLSGNLPKIVLHHGPWGVEYMNEYGIDVVLTGHTHAGQVFPATLIADKTFPYNKGLSNHNGTYIYVSQGAGTFLPRMRLFTQNEINFITLKPMED